MRGSDSTKLEPMRFQVRIEVEGVVRVVVLR